MRIQKKLTLAKTAGRGTPIRFPCLKGRCLEETNLMYRCSQRQLPVDGQKFEIGLEFLDDGYSILAAFEGAGFCHVII